MERVSILTYGVGSWAPGNKVGKQAQVTQYAHSQFELAVKRLLIDPSNGERYIDPIPSMEDASADQEYDIRMRINTRALNTSIEQAGRLFDRLWSDTMGAVARGARQSGIAVPGFQAELILGRYEWSRLCDRGGVIHQQSVRYNDDVRTAR